MMYFIFLFGGISMMEGKNLIFPYIDTEFASNYSPEKFDLITEDFSYNEVIQLVGKPLSEKKDSFGNIIEVNYTNDGKTTYKNNPFVLVGDFAWYRSYIRFDSNGKIIEINSGWSYD